MQPREPRNAQKNETNHRRLSVLIAGLSSTLMFAVMTEAVAGPITLSEYQAANQEGQVQFDFSRQPFAAGSDRVKLRFDNDSLRRTLRVDAGLFGANAEAVAGDPFDPASLYRSEDDVLLYCVDLFDDLKKDQNTYNVLRISDDTLVQTSTDGHDVIRNFGQVLDFLGALNSTLASDYGLSYGEQNWLNPQQGWMSGAIQVGIWESLYDEAMDITTGNFRVWTHGNRGQALSSDGIALLDASFAAMASTDALSDTGVRWFQLDAGQDLLGDPLPIPAPATGLLVLSGLLLLGHARRRSSNGLRM
jgi:hypothetical protein